MAITQESETVQFPLDVLTLMVIAESKERGVRNADITARIIEINKKGIPVVEPAFRYSAFGLVSDEIYNILTLFLGNRYIQQLSPATITDTGNAFLQERINQYLKDNTTKEICEDLLKTIKLP